MKKQKPIQTYIPEEDYIKLKEKATNDGVLVATYVRRLILKELKL